MISGRIKVNYFAQTGFIVEARFSNNPLSMDTQLLHISKEELSLKRKLVEKLEKSKEDFNSGMNKVFKSMENTGSCIQQTVDILAHLVNQQ